MTARLLAPALGLAVFGYCSVLGYAALTLVRRPRPAGQHLLLAPSVGVAILLLPTFWISWLGVPVERFAAPLGITLFAFAAAVFVWGRPKFPIRLAGQFALPIGAAFVLAGWPLFTLGFSWLAYANDDMVNYCLLAERLLHYGLTEEPSTADLLRGTDLSLSFWFLEIAIARPGSQLLLAWLGAIGGRPLPELFMPLLLSLHIALVASAGALVYRRPSYKAAALATCWLLAASALTTFGTMAQLIAQVLGLALGASLVAIAWSVTPSSRFRGRDAVLLGTVGAAFLLAYPEVAPFIAPAIVWRIASVAYRSGRLSSLSTFAGAAGVGLLFLAPYASRVIGYVLAQAEGGGGSANNHLFPFYLVPSGFAAFWGFLALAHPLAEPWLSASIATGALLAIVASVWAIGVVRHGDATAMVFLWTLIAVPVLFFVRDSGFGLFKLAMYAQPFLLGTLALRPLLRHAPLGSRHLRGRVTWPHTAFLLLLALTGLHAQRTYVTSSVRGFTSLELGDYEELVTDLNEVRLADPESLDVDLPDMPLAKLLGLYAKGSAVRMINVELAPSPADPTGAERARLAQESLRETRRFAVLDPARPGLENEYEIWTGASAASGSHDSNGHGARCQSLVTETASQTVLNRFRPIDDAGNAVTMVPCARVKNHLAFVSSTLGRHYHLDYGRDGPDGRIGLFGLEPDPFAPEHSMAGLGRYLLLEVINPSPRVRLQLDATATFAADGRAALPPGHIVGSTRAPLALVGHGSARVYSPPLLPQVIDGRSYLLLDLGVEPTRRTTPRSGLMALFGRDVPLDSRAIVAHARNISAVSESEYLALRPPSSIDAFPGGLADASLEYSGVYEDGRVGEVASLRLTRPAGATRLVVRGHAQVPVDSQNPLTAQIRLGGQTISSHVLTSTPFAISVPMVPGGEDVVSITLRFSSARWSSPVGDRPVVARLERIAFE